jgi:hypothetical protein
MSDMHIAGVREALSILDQSAHDMQEWMQELSSIEVTRTQWLKVLDIIEPPAPADSSKVKVTKTNNRRDLLDSIYKGEGELGALNGPFAGTVFGGVQADNTYQHHGIGAHATGPRERVASGECLDDGVACGSQDALERAREPFLGVREQDQRRVGHGGAVRHDRRRSNTRAAAG